MTNIEYQVTKLPHLVPSYHSLNMHCLISLLKRLTVFFCLNSFGKIVQNQGAE